MQVPTNANWNEFDTQPVFGSSKGQAGGRDIFSQSRLKRNRNPGPGSYQAFSPVKNSWGYIAREA